MNNCQWMNFNGETRVLRDVVQIIFFLTFRQAFQLQIRNCRWLKLLKLLKLYKSLGVLENLQLKATALLSVFTFISYCKRNSWSDMFNSSIYYFQSTSSGQFSWLFFSSDASNLELLNIRKLTFGIFQIEYRLISMNNIYSKDMNHSNTRSIRL